MRPGRPSIVSSVVMVMRSPARSSMGSPPRSLPVRILGPERSCSSAIGRSSLEAIARAASTPWRCCSCSPWEKLRRITSTPASISWSSTGRSREAGPTVATILVRRTRVSIAARAGRTIMPAVAARARQRAGDQQAPKGRAGGRKPPVTAPPASRVWLSAAVLFVGALAVRLLFWQAAPGVGWPHSPFFKGDAVVWLQHALALERGRPFELDLPLRPPGAAYLITLLWDGRQQTLPWLRAAWLVQGALIPPLMFVALLRPLGATVAWLASAAAAASTGLILLSSSLNNETPYVLLAVAGIALFEPLRRQPSVPRLFAWSVLHGVGCLLRVEHLLFYLASLALLAFSWPRQAAGA